MEAVLLDSLALYELKDSMRHPEMLMGREYYTIRPLRLSSTIVRKTMSAESAVMNFLFSWFT